MIPWRHEGLIFSNSKGEAAFKFGRDKFRHWLAVPGNDNFFALFDQLESVDN